MKIFPPSPNDYDAAIAYVNSLRKRKGASDFRSINNASMSFFLMGSWILVLVMKTALRDLSWFGITSSLILFIAAIFSWISAYRLNRLLQIFDDGSTFEARLSKSADETHTDDSNLNS